VGVTDNFGEYYKTISNAELLSILDKPTGYQEEAIKAAKKEFSHRNLSSQEVKEARQELFEKQKQKIQQQEKIKAVEKKIKSTGQAVVNNLNPFQTGISSVEKNIRIIVLSFAILFLYQLITGFKTTLFYIKGIIEFPLDSAFYLLPLVLLPISTFLFWKRKKAGWILLVAFITFTTVLTIASMIRSFFWEPSGFTALDNLFQRPTISSIIISMLILIGTLYVLCRPKLRQAYSIDDWKMYASIILSGFATLALMFVTD